MAQHLGRALALAGALALLCPAPAAAQHITVDGTLSPAQTLTGPNYPITANLGKQVGGNLFHSFGAFGLIQGESANFSGPANVANCRTKWRRCIGCKAAGNWSTRRSRNRALPAS